MHPPTTNFWPTARHYAEAVQCPAVCFDEPSLKALVPAVDRLGMPLVTSGQFAYVFKLNPADGAGESLAVRCFRGFLGDREERYRALDEHLDAHRVGALPLFKYLPRGILVAGRRYPALVMEWVEGPTLDVYLDEAVGRRDALLHLAEEWLRLCASLRAAGVAHGDLQHGNIIVGGGRLRLVDLDGMYAPALEGFRASEVGHQHYQHPARNVTHFSRDTDNFSALVVYLSLVSLAERPDLWREHHDENLIFTRADFADPDSSALFRKVEAMGGEHARLAAALRLAALAGPAETPPLTDLVQVNSSLPVWMNAPPGLDVRGRTREVAPAAAPAPVPEGFWASRQRQRPSPQTPASQTVQSIFNAGPGGAVAAQRHARPAPRDPADLRGNTLFHAKNVFGNSYGYIWWIPLHNFLLRHLWLALGVGDTLAGMLLTFAMLLGLCLFYGLFRAVYEAESAPASAAGPALPLPLSGPPAAAGAPPPASLFGAAAPAAAATPPQQAARPVVGNRSLNIYHLADCDWAAKITPRQRADFDSPAAARAAGFRPCRVCKP
ncbi:MAG TPA: Ada metal-binding domain-containing protein [Pyrinomonadaceae bacterium]|jgi:hypothetical protein